MKSRKSATQGMERRNQAFLGKSPIRVVACRSCGGTELRAFGSVLIEALGGDEPATEYIRSVPVKCSNCGRPIGKNTMVRCEEGEAVPLTARSESAKAISKESLPGWKGGTNLVFVEETILMQAQSAVTGCGKCVPAAEMTFDYILDAVTGCDPATTEYVLNRPAKCPRCMGKITEKTFVIAH